MKKLLLLFLVVSTVAFGQNKGIFRSTAALGLISVNVQKNQYVGTPNTFTATITPINAIVAGYRWEVFDSKTLAREKLSFDPTPSFGFTAKKFYDVRLTIYTATQTLTKYVRHAFRVFNARPPTAGNCDIVIDFATNTDYFGSFTGLDKAGTTIALTGSGAAGHKIEFFNLKSSDPSNPVRIITYGNAHLRGNATVGHTLWFSGDCDNIIVEGYKEDGAKGLVIENSLGGSQLVYADGRFTGIQFHGVSLIHSPSVDAAALGMVGRTASDSRAENWTIDNFAVYNCTFTDCGEECNYLNFNNDDNHPSGFTPPKMIDPIVAWNDYHGSGRDNLQIGSSVGIEAHDNSLSNWGKQMDTGGQTNAISWNGGSAGQCYNNIGSGGEVFLNIQSGKYPWNIFTGETVPRSSSFFNNVIWNGAYSAWSAPNEPMSIYMQTLTGTGNPGPWQVNIYNNTFTSDKKLSEFFAHANGFNLSLKMFNNIFVKTADAGYLPEFNFTGEVTTAATRTTANITLSGEQTINGVTTSGSAVLVMAQTDQKQNGLYSSASGSWTRHSAGDTNAELQTLQAKITGGTQANQLWYQATPTITIGSSNITFADRFTARVINNTVREVGTESDILLTGYTSPINASDLSIAALSSSAYSGSPTDLATELAGIISAEKYYDVLGYPLLAPSTNYTWGAYSGYQKRKFPFTPVDAAAASFTSGPAVGSLTNFTGQLTYEANKIGLLYYVLSASITQPTIAQIVAGQIHTGSAGIASGFLYDFGTAENVTFTGLTSATTYYCHYFFKTVDFVEGSIGTASFTTTSDVTAPVISGFTIPDGNRDRINFSSSEVIVANNSTGYTVASPSKTISSTFINTGQLTGHYWMVSVPFAQSDFGAAPTIAYTAGGTPAIEDTAGNDLANFGATVITNSILPQIEADVVWTDIVNATAGSGSTADDLTATGNGASGRSAQIIPSTSSGYVRFTYDALERSNFQTCRIGLIAATDARTYANIKMGLDIRANNLNVDVYEGAGPGAYKATASNNQGSGYIYQFRIDRGTSKIYYETSTNGGGTWTTNYTYSGTVTGDLRLAVVMESTRAAINCKIEAQKGLQ